MVFLLWIACASSTLYVKQESDTLYFGTTKPGGAVVTSEEWDAFVADTISPRFPGFTEWVAHGHWKGTDEKTHVVVIVHSSNSAAVAEIVEAYKKRFSQEAVLVVRSEVWLPKN